MRRRIFRLVQFAALVWLFAMAPRANAMKMSQLREACGDGEEACFALIFGELDMMNYQSGLIADENLIKAGVNPLRPGYADKLLAEMDKISGICEPKGHNEELVRFALAMMKVPAEAGNPSQQAATWLIQQWREHYPYKAGGCPR